MLQALLRRLPWLRNNAVKTLLVLLGATAFSLVMNLLFSSFDTMSMIVIYLLAVVIISRITTGYFWGMFASVISVVVVNYYFTYPYAAFDFTRAGYPITFVSMLLVSFITSAMTAQITRQARLSVLREERTKKLYEITRLLLVTHGQEDIVELVLSYLYDFLHRPVIFYADDPQQGCKGALRGAQAHQELILSSPSEQFTAHWAFLHNEQAGCGTEVCTGSHGLYQPVVSRGRVLAVLGLLYDDGTRPEPEQLAYLDALSSQIAMALDRQRLSDEQRAIVVEAEKEKMRSNLLRAISHDLRTPLTSILGASSAILENRERLDLETHNKLLGDIREDSQWLIRMVENLLTVTRIKGGGAALQKRPEPAEEIVGDAVARIRARYPNYPLHVRVPDELLMVPMDATLIEQVIINLIENAIRHGAPQHPSVDELPIEVSVTRSGEFAVFEVRDYGRGIKPDEIPHLFEGYDARGQHSSDSSRGMGIGLSICNSIVLAHSGTITAANKAECGAVFTFTLPLEEETEACLQR